MTEILESENLNQLENLGLKEKSKMSSLISLVNNHVTLDEVLYIQDSIDGISTALWSMSAMVFGKTSLSNEGIETLFDAQEKQVMHSLESMIKGFKQAKQTAGAK